MPRNDPASIEPASRPTADCPATAAPPQLPTYAMRNCLGAPAAKYSSVCSCLGVTATTTTLPVETVTVYPIEERLSTVYYSTCDSTYTTDEPYTPATTDEGTTSSCSDPLPTVIYDTTTTTDDGATVTITVGSDTEMGKRAYQTQADRV